MTSKLKLRGVSPAVIVLAAPETARERMTREYVERHSPKPYDFKKSKPEKWRANMMERDIKEVKAIAHEC